MPLKQQKHKQANRFIAGTADRLQMWEWARRDRLEPFQTWTRVRDTCSSHSLPPLQRPGQTHTLVSPLGLWPVWIIWLLLLKLVRGNPSPAFSRHWLVCPSDPHSSILGAACASTLIGCDICVWGDAYISLNYSLICMSVTLDHEWRFSMTQRHLNNLTDAAKCSEIPNTHTRKQN